MHGVMVTRRVPLVDIDLGRYKRVANRRRGSKPLAVLFHLYFLCNNNRPYNERIINIMEEVMEFLLAIIAGCMVIITVIMLLIASSVWVQYKVVEKEIENQKW